MWRKLKVPVEIIHIWMNSICKEKMFPNFSTTPSHPTSCPSQSKPPRPCKVQTGRPYQIGLAIGRLLPAIRNQGKHAGRNNRAAWILILHVCICVNTYKQTCHNVATPKNTGWYYSSCTTRIRQHSTSFQNSACLFHDFTRLVKDGQGSRFVKPPKQHALLWHDLLFTMRHSFHLQYSWWWLAK